MKNRFLKTIGTTALAILMLTVFSHIRVSAQDGDDQDKNTQQKQENDSTRQRDAQRLIGTWEVQVTIRNCQTGAAIRSFPSVITFMEGGTYLESTAGIPQALKTPGHGVWSHIEGNLYQLKFKSFNFDAAGNFTGWTIIKHEPQLDRSADETASTGTFEVYAPNGVLVASGCSTTTGTRF